MQYRRQRPSCKSEVIFKASKNSGECFHVKRSSILTLMSIYFTLPPLSIWAQILQEVRFSASEIFPQNWSCKSSSVFWQTSITCRLSLWNLFWKSSTDCARIDRSFLSFVNVKIMSNFREVQNTELQALFFLKKNALWFLIALKRSL